MQIRFAMEQELPAINLLRREVHDLHAAGRPQTFQPDFCAELERYLYEHWKNPSKRIVVADQAGALCGFAVLQEIHRDETPYSKRRSFLEIEEFGVAASHRRQGIGTALIDFIRNYAETLGLARIELNMWEFNQTALAFYEALGFTTYRRFMELRAHNS